MLFKAFTILLKFLAISPISLLDHCSILTPKSPFPTSIILDEIFLIGRIINLKSAMPAIIIIIIVTADEVIMNKPVLFKKKIAVGV